MEWWLWVLCGIAGLLLLILFSDIVLAIRYDGENFTLTAGILFIRIRIFPRPEKKGKASSKTSGQSKPKKKSDLGLSALTETLDKILYMAKSAIAKMRISPCRICIRVAEKDAAATAITYGVCCAGLVALQQVFTRFFGGFSGDFNVTWDYTGGKTSATANVKLKLRVLWLPVILIKTALRKE